MNMNPATIKMMCGLRKDCVDCLRKDCVGCKYEYEGGKCRLNTVPCFWKIDGIEDEQWKAYEKLSPEAQRVVTELIRLLAEAER
jgi:hypothetical protein